MRALRECGPDTQLHSIKGATTWRPTPIKYAGNAIKTQKQSTPTVQRHTPVRQTKNSTGNVCVCPHPSRNIAASENIGSRPVQSTVARQKQVLFSLHLHTQAHAGVDSIKKVVTQSSGTTTT